MVMSPHEPPQAFVDNYMRLLTENDVLEFQKVLEMKVGSKIQNTKFWDMFFTIEDVLLLC